jgi:large subunit ribosomal protein L5e
LNIPHKVKRLAGYDAENDKFDPAILRKYIFGGHVADYMRKLQKENPERYKRQFSRYIANKIDAGSLEAMYKKAHAAIRQDPEMKKVRCFVLLLLLFVFEFERIRFGYQRIDV